MFINIRCITSWLIFVLHPPESNSPYFFKVRDYWVTYYYSLQNLFGELVLIGTLIDLAAQWASLAKSQSTGQQDCLFHWVPNVCGNIFAM
jgi:hypothetical protein